MHCGIDPRVQSAFWVHRAPKPGWASPEELDEEPEDELDDEVLALLEPLLVEAAIPEELAPAVLERDAELRPVDALVVIVPEAEEELVEVTDPVLDTPVELLARPLELLTAALPE